jgi:hypothetical protein
MRQRHENVVKLRPILPTPFRIPIHQSFGNHQGDTYSPDVRDSIVENDLHQSSISFHFLQSVVYGRIHFLRELGNAEARLRKTLLRYMTEGQMEALAEVFRYIV